MTGPDGTWPRFGGNPSNELRNDAAGSINDVGQPQPLPGMEVARKRKDAASIADSRV